MTAENNMQVPVLPTDQAPTVRMNRAIERQPETQERIAQIDKQVKWHSRATLALVLIGLGAALWATFVFSINEDDLSQLGDFFGVVGAMWSLAGLILIYIAFLGQQRQTILQEEDLEINRTELRDTREELRGQKEQLKLQQKEMEVQNETLRRQSFENTFFQLLRFVRESAQNLRARPAGSDEPEYKGLLAFQHAIYQLQRRIGREFLPPPTDKQLLELLTVAYKDICHVPHSDFGYYFRSLYHLVRLIDESKLRDRRRDMLLLRAQLSHAEQLLLFVNSLSPYGRKHFKKLIEKYGLLKGIRLPTEFRKFEDFYEREAYR